MKRALLILLFLFNGSQAFSDELSDNPAFCSGFLAEQSKKDAGTVEKLQSSLQIAFATSGPKDCTDSRSFNDWQKIGREVAADGSYKRYAPTLRQCRTLITKITH